MRLKKKDILILIIIFIYTGILITYSNADNDLIWNYGFSYNFANHLLMYKDYNMVITPLYPFLGGILMRILGNNFLIFNLYNTILSTILYYYLYKKYPHTFIPSIILISFILRPSYNFLVLFLVLILLNIKEEKDFFIGFILGLLFLTKQSFILLILPSIYLITKPKRLFKRIGAFFIPCLFFLIYFILTNTFLDFLNYTFLGLFSFSSKNSFFNLGTIFILSLIIYLFLYYLKTKDIKVLYLITYQIMAYPIFNTMHVILSIIPVIIYFLDKLVKKKKYNLNYLRYFNYFASIILICPVLSIPLQYFNKDLVEGENALEYKDISRSYLVNKDLFLKEIPNLNNTYFLMYDAYIYKYLLNNPITSYDLLLNGNLGYNGEERVIDYFNSLDSNTYFALNRVYTGGQLSKNIDAYIRNHYLKVKDFQEFTLYKKSL